jgi:hypothetical protein
VSNGQVNGCVHRFWHPHVRAAGACIGTSRETSPDSSGRARLKGFKSPDPVAGSQVVVKVRMTGGVVEREELRIGANPFSFPRIMCGVVVVEVGELRLRSAVDDEPLLGRGPRPVAPEAAARPPWWRSQPHDPPRTCPVPLLPRSGIVSPTQSRTSSSGPVNLGPIGPTIPFLVSRRLPPPWYQGVVGTLL